MAKNKKPKQHPAPTNSTLKELYANAYCCAFPNCKKPLYKIDNENGNRTLNSRAAHICARSEGGPRWNPDQTRNDNRSIQNLIALCIEHAYEIDDIKNVAKYSANLLREWKQAQLNELDHFSRQGWSLNGEDINTLKEYSNNIDIDINQSTIDIGGKGGNAPGAGGGGGGTFGSINSKGGEGGKGGNTINLQGSKGNAPGAGGGGDGALGNNAQGAGGGEGGERITTTISAKEFDRIEFDVGKGGRKGENGENTTAKLIKDGKTIRTIPATGGKAGKPGHHGDVSGLARPISKEELDNGGGISIITLAEYARIKDGLFTLIDAGWDTYSVPTLPYSAVWPVFITFSIVNIETPSVIKFTLRVKNQNGSIVTEIDIPLIKDNELAMKIPCIYPVSLEIAGHGIWTIEVSSGEHLLASLPITVKGNQ